MRRLKIAHTTGFSYPSPVSASYNEARLSPLDTTRQFLLHTRVDIAPVTGRDAFVDYWGTRVTSFEVLARHEQLSVSAESLVEIQPREHVPGELTWTDLQGIGDRSVELSDQLFETAYTKVPPEVAEIATRIRSESPRPADAARRICDEIGGSIEYLRGVTEVSSTAAEAWEHGKGVCQDIAHVTLSALRSVGIPARYVSGYLQPRADLEIGEEAVGESHAWVEWYCGDWTGYDPTNSAEIADGHVIVGRGRDYHDVAPLRGIYAGPSGADLFVEVKVTRET